MRFQVQPWTGGKQRIGRLPQAGTHVGKFSGCHTGPFEAVCHSGSLKSSSSMAFSTQDKPTCMKTGQVANMPVLENSVVWSRHDENTLLASHSAQAKAPWCSSYYYLSQTGKWKHGVIQQNIQYLPLVLMSQR